LDTTIHRQVHTSLDLPVDLLYSQNNIERGLGPNNSPENGSEPVSALFSMLTDIERNS
ncbi:20426_t:CDS:2, partial [Gigaspora rosea]